MAVPALVAVALPGVAAVDAEAQTAAPSPAFFLCTARTIGSTLAFYEVPPEITRLGVVAAGGSGAIGHLTGNERAGKGALVQAVVSVSPGDRLGVVAGCDANGRRGGPGWGDGGDGGKGTNEAGGGGGGSAVVLVRSLAISPLVVAGGGGGAGAPSGGTNGRAGGDGSGTNSGNRTAVTTEGGRGEDGEHLLGDAYLGVGGGGGGGGARGGRGGSGSTFFNPGPGGGGRGGSSLVTSRAEPGSQIVAGGAARGPGFVVLVPLITSQRAPTALTFDCRPNQPSMYELFSAPVGATRMFAAVQGGAGGYANPDITVRLHPGGRGAIVHGVLPVAPGELYRAKAGCRGGGRDADGSFNPSRDNLGGNGYGNGGNGGRSAACDGFGSCTTSFRAGGGGGGSAVLTYDNWRALIIAGAGGGGGGDGPAFSDKGGWGGDGSFFGERGGGDGGGAGGARDVVHGGDGATCTTRQGGGGGGGAGLRAGLGGAAGCGSGGGGGGGGSSLQPPGGTTMTLQSGPRSDGWVVVVLI